MSNVYCPELIDLSGLITFRHVLKNHAAKIHLPVRHVKVWERLHVYGENMMLKIHNKVRKITQTSVTLGQLVCKSSLPL